MWKKAISIFILVILLSQIALVSATDVSTATTSTTVFKKIAYYPDGTIMNVLTVESEGGRVRSSVSETFTYAAPPIEIPIDLFKQIGDFLNQISKFFDPLYGICVLLASTILLIIKGLRHNRPRDYRGIEKVLG